METTSDIFADTNRAGGNPGTVHLACVSVEEPRWLRFATRMQEVSQGDLAIKWLPTLRDLAQHIHRLPADAVILSECWTPMTSPIAVRETLQTVQAAIGGSPLVVLSPLPCDEWASEVTLAGGVVSVSPRLWDSPALPTLVIAALQRRRQDVELQHLRDEQLRRKALDQADAQALLNLQKSMLERIQERSGPHVARVPSENRLGTYGELLRASLVAGPGSLRTEIQRLARQLASDRVSPAEILSTHLSETEKLLAGLGARSSRQIAARATLLAVDLLAALGELYRGPTVRPPAPAFRRPA